MISYKNLQITFTLCSEMIIPDYPIGFDALLMKALTLKENLSLEQGKGISHSPELPIERHQGSSLYLASVGFIRSEGRNVQFYTKRYSGDLPHDLDLSGGYFKAYHRNIYTLACQVEVTFYCRGVPSAIQELTGFIPALGAKRSQGYGKVARVHVEEIKEDKSWIYRNEPMRAIPIRYYEDKLHHWYYAFTSPIPPGFAPELKEVCYLPRPSSWLSIAADSGMVQGKQHAESRGSASFKKKKSLRTIWHERSTE
ncbi:hypothetical protein [Paenibacillus sp. OV219]|uniref:hypothetical protein n=1 Tax=Paenibacillus sp. OV219 TaxID=1884377 RepID=UPI0008C7A6F2|nr:hypothetical protein [Paenibacillus sp. OV219]SEN05058.1 CRISPR type IV/AFERR-associated protein Csf3 [Paenibacillus sp. OV219]